MSIAFRQVDSIEREDEITYVKEKGAYLKKREPTTSTTREL
jgi:hypothetical protein